MGFQTSIFSYFGRYEANTDTYRDANGKGVMQRFNEVIGKDMDSIVRAIEQMQVNYLDIHTADMYTLKLLCAENGVPFDLIYKGSDVGVIRRIAKYGKSIVEWRGSLNGVKLITYLILPPTSVNVIEVFADFSLDSSTTLDSPIRRLDSGGNFTDLIFDYTNTSLSSDSEKETLRRITEYNTPFDCISRTRLNGVFI